MLLRDYASYGFVVVSDQFTSREEGFITRMWQLTESKGNAEGSGFIKDRNLSSPGRSS